MIYSIIAFYVNTSISRSVKIIVRRALLTDSVNIDIGAIIYGDFGAFCIGVESVHVGVIAESALIVCVAHKTSC